MEDHDGSSMRRYIPMLGTALVLPAVGLLLFSATGRDDSHITFWAADVLARTGSIVNYNGELVEQSSTLLQTLLLALVSWTGIVTTPTAALLLGALAGAASVVLAWRLADDIDPGAGVAAGLFSATSTYLVYWSLSGMETSLVALAAVAFAVAGGRYVVGRGSLAPAAAAAAAWVLVRPEGIFVLLAALVGTTVLVRPVWRRSAVLAVAALVVFAGVTGWRLAVFGLPFPQPVMAKVGGLGVPAGLRYLWEWATPALAVLTIAAGAGFALRPRQPLAVLAGAVVAAQVGFVVTSGGDWMEGGRMVVPVLPVLCALAAVGVRRNARATPVAVLILLLNVGGLLWFARYVSTGQPLWASSNVTAEFAWPERVNRVHARDALFLPRFASVLKSLDEGLDRPVRYASAQAGMVPYYTLEDGPDVEFIDRWALTTRRTEACRTHTEAPSAYGRELTYAAWADATDDCGPLPDVVVELGSSDDLPPGYTEVHRKEPRATARASLFPGWRLRAGEYVAVRNELLGLLDSD